MKTETNAITVGLYAMGAAVLLFLMAFLVWAMYAWTRSEAVGQPRAEARLESLREMAQTNRIELETYGWADPDNGLVRLPIREAMRIVALEWENPEEGRSALLNRIPAPIEFE
jgi:hypothetical protein